MRHLGEERELLMSLRGYWKERVGRERVFGGRRRAMIWPEPGVRGVNIGRDNWVGKYWRELGIIVLKSIAINSSSIPHRFMLLILAILRRVAIARFPRGLHGGGSSVALK